jgi:hypothetical protein
LLEITAGNAAQHQAQFTFNAVLAKAGEALAKRPLKRIAPEGHDQYLCVDKAFVSANSIFLLKKTHRNR